MRRLFAFITLAITLLIVTIVGVPSIKDSMKSGTEFDGGYTILYHLTDQDDLEYKGAELDDKMKKAASYVNERLNALNVSSPEVSVEGGSYLRVTVPDLTAGELKSVKYALANNAEITVRDENGNLLCEGEDLFASLSLINSNGTTYLQCKVKDYDLLKDITGELADHYSGTEEQPKVNMVVWMGFEETYTESVSKMLDGQVGDSYYEAADGCNDYSAFKVLTAVAIDQQLTADFSVQANVTPDHIKVTQKILNQDKVSYVLNQEYSSEYGSYLGTETPNKAVIAGIVALVVVLVLLIIFYNLSGVAAGLSIILETVVVLVAYNLFGGLFGTETIVAMAICLGFAVDANVVFLERIKDEIKKGKSMERAFEEGSKKTISTVLDANVVGVVAAFALYLFGNQVVKSFAAVLLLNQVAIMLIVIFITRIMFSLLCHSKYLSNKPSFFGVKEDEIADINDVEARKEVTNRFSKVDFTKKGKKGLIGGIIILAGIVVAFVGQFAFNGKAFTYNANVGSGTKIYFRTINTDCSTEEKVKVLFESDELVGRKPDKIVISTDTVEFDKNDIVEYKDVFEKYFGTSDKALTDYNGKLPVYSVTVFYDNELSSAKIDSIDERFNAEKDAFWNEDEEIKIFETNYFAGDYQNYSGRKAVINGLLALALLAAFTFIYLSIRFSFSYSFASVAIIIFNEAIYAACLAITRLPIGVEAVAVGIGVAALTINNLTITFDRLRENVGETKNMVWTKEVRLSYVNKALQQTMFGHCLATAVIIIVALGVALFALKPTLSLAAQIILAALVCFYGCYLIMPFVWAQLDTDMAIAKANRKSRRASKAKPATKTGEAEEYIFFGIND